MSAPSPPSDDRDPPAPDPLAGAVRVILDLGLVPGDELQARATAWRERPPSEDTADESSEVHGFLASLQQAGLLSPSQLRALLGMLARGPAPDLAQDPAIGQRFGDYVAEAKVGEGASAKVYRATHAPSGSSDYVIKVFSAPEDADALARFRREGDVMAALCHPNVVRVYESGDHEALPYLVMERVDGYTLQAVVERKGHFPWEGATRAVRQLASGLAAAHALGVTHRDVKPHNVLVSRSGNLKLCDFGLAKTTAGALHSRAGQILGSPAYIAPEQWGDHQVDHRADLFAVGVIYYLLLTGATPFRGRTPAEYASRIQGGRFAPIEGYAPQVPPGVRHVVHQLLERDRRYRTPTAAALVADVGRLLSGEAPGVPRLERPGESFALVGDDTFVVGSGPEADLWLSEEGIAPVHARIDRTKAGLLLSRPESGGRVRVNGQRIDEVILKDGDEVRLADLPAFAYREGNLAGGGAGADLLVSSEPEGPEADPGDVAAPRPAPGLLVAALEEAGHPYALLCSIEAIDARTAEDALGASRRRLVGAGLAAETAERAAQRARYLVRQRADWLAERLFQATHENLGHDVAAWLSWWFEARERFPLQVRPPGPRPVGRLVVYRRKSDPEPIELGDAEAWVVGRADQADVPLRHRSVSRRHVRLERLVQRFAFQDLGSRLGTRLEGQRQEVGLLRHGDVLDIGRLQVELQSPALEPPAGEGRIPIDRATFSGLIEMRSETVVEALTRLLDAPARLEECRPAAAELELDPEAALRPFLDAHRVLALEALPAITGTNFGDDAAAWDRWLAERRGDLPPQADPFGAAAFE